jgi:hypothetical protein
MRLADHVDPKRLKELNLLLLLEGAKQVGGGAELRKRTRERAKMIRDDLLQALLDEVPDVPQAKARQAWSHWMALVTMRQRSSTPTTARPWPRSTMPRCRNGDSSTRCLPPTWRN